MNINDTLNHIESIIGNPKHKNCVICDMLKTTKVTEGSS